MTGDATYPTERTGEYAGAEEDVKSPLHFMRFVIHGNKVRASYSIFSPMLPHGWYASFAPTWKEACFKQSKQKSAYDKARVALSDTLAGGDNTFVNY